MATTTKKTSTTRTSKATTKAVETNVSAEPVVEAKKEVKTYDQEETLLCRSLTRGELLLKGKKSGEIYSFADYGDEIEIEYRDLLSMRATKNNLMFEAYFIITEDELFDDPKWSDLKKVYDKIMADDIDELLNMNINDFKKALPNLPSGVKQSLLVAVSTQMEEGTFDSIQKIKAVDEVCGTDLASLL